MPIMGVELTRIWLFPKRLRDHALALEPKPVERSAVVFEVFKGIERHFVLLQKCMHLKPRGEP